MPAAGSPGVPVLLTGESIGVPLPAAGKGGRGVEFGEVHCDTPIAIPSPAPLERGRRDRRCWLLFICLRRTAAWEAEGRLGASLTMRTCRSAGRDTRPAGKDSRPAGRGGAGQAGRDTRGSPAANKGRERLLHVCAAAAGPAASAAHREGPAAPLLPGCRAGRRARSGPGASLAEGRGCSRVCLRDIHVRPHRPKVTAAGPTSRYGPH